jgi:hypothetical protein
MNGDRQLYPKVVSGRFGFSPRPRLMQVVIGVGLMLFLGGLGAALPPSVRKGFAFPAGILFLRLRLLFMPGDLIEIYHNRLIF